jgi:predicted nuclease of restriction endonuclease-like (RecB) superfamily
MGSEIDTINKSSHQLFERVSTILEQAKLNVVCSVNHNTVLANWLIGREIVLELQKGEDRAGYGTQLLDNLSKELNEAYGSGYSVTNLKYFRIFYQAFSDRITESNRHPVGDQSYITGKRHPLGDESSEVLCSPSSREIKTAFSPRLSWSHYRALMRVKDQKERDFYEKEASECGWDKRDLERQILSQYYKRILSSQNPQAMIEAGRRELTQKGSPIDTLKNPYVLEFLNLPDMPVLHETHLESAIITQLQSFLLELGKGFAFVGRQKRLQFEDKDLFVDLVFYNCILKCYLLIDLKTGELTHADVGQMDGYVRLFDDQYAIEGDNPTIGLILCTEKNEAVAKYSVLNDRKQIFASKYMTCLPTEEQLVNEIKREMRLIENVRELQDRHTGLTSEGDSNGDV